MTLRAVSGCRTTGILLALLGCLGACSKPDMQLTIPFAAYFGQEPLGCDQTVGAVQLTDLRLYVADVYLLDAKGERTQFDLLADGAWQQGDLALLDFENDSGACANGTGIVRRELQGRVPPGDYRGLIFEVGVPFDRNHGDPLLAEPPLGDTAMHWSWRGGYKFLRAGVSTATDGFWLHLGSTGCAGKINAISGCSSANRVAVTLADFEPGRHRVAIDLAELFAAVDLSDAVPGDCSSGPAETQCEAVFGALGLDFNSGASVRQQRVFETRELQ